MNYFRCVWITFRWLLQSMIDVLDYHYFYIIFIQESIYIFRHLALVEILEIEDGILDFKLLNVVIFLFLKATWLFNHLTISQSSRTFYVCVPVEENLFTVVVDLLYPPRTSTCPRNFFAQANSPTPGDLSNKSLSQYAGG